MNSGNQGQIPTPSLSVRLTADEFETIFQVTKELGVLPTSVLAGVGWGSADVDRLQSVARGIRGRTDATHSVIVHIGGHGADEKTPAPPVVVDAKRGSVTDKEAVAKLPYHLGREWRRMAEAVVSLLGARETFLRTGYGADDVLAALRRLP